MSAEPDVERDADGLPTWEPPYPCPNGCGWRFWGPDAPALHVHLAVECDPDSTKQTNAWSTHD